VCKYRKKTPGGKLPEVEPIDSQLEAETGSLTPGMEQNSPLDRAAHYVLILTEFLPNFAPLAALESQIFLKILIYFGVLSTDDE